MHGKRTVLVHKPLSDAETLSFVAGCVFTPICCVGRIQRLGRNCLRRAQRRDGRDGCRAAGGGPLADGVRPAQALTCSITRLCLTRLSSQSPDSVSPAVAAAASEAEAADRRNPRQAQPPHTPPASVSVHPPAQPQVEAPQLCDQPSPHHPAASVVVQPPPSGAWPVRPAQPTPSGWCAVA